MAISNGMCLTRFAHLDLKFPIFLSQYAYCDVNIDIFLLNLKGLESMSIVPKNFCNMQIVRHNMHIAIESILPLTYRSNAH